jgi:outer membrane protein TolC
MKLIPSYLKILIAGLFLAPGLLQAQGKAGEESMSLDECVAYALENRAAMEQARIDEAIGEREVRASLSGWLPQVSARLNGIHNLKLRQQPFGDQIITLGQ